MTQEAQRPNSELDLKLLAMFSAMAATITGTCGAFYSRLPVTGFESETSVASGLLGGATMASAGMAALLSLALLVGLLARWSDDEAKEGLATTIARSSFIPLVFSAIILSLLPCVFLVERWEPMKKAGGIFSDAFGERFSHLPAAALSLVCLLTLVHLFPQPLDFFTDLKYDRFGLLGPAGILFGAAFLQLCFTFDVPDTEVTLNISGELTLDLRLGGSAPEPENLRAEFSRISAEGSTSIFSLLEVSPGKYRLRESLADFPPGDYRVRFFFSPGPGGWRATTWFLLPVTMREKWVEVRIE